MLQNREYWTKRSILLEIKLLDKGESYLENLNNLYRKISLDIEKDLSVWYSRFAKNNSISIIEAKKWLTTRELKEFKWTVREYIKYGQMNNINQKWMKQLENASAKYHITRLEALKTQLQHHVEVLYDNQLNGVDKTMRDIYTEGYFNAAYEFQKTFNIGFNLMRFDDNELKKILSKPWAIDGSNFSDRIWGNKTNLVNTLHQQLTSMIVKGESPDKAIKVITTKFNVTKANAGRLVMTESAYFASKSQEDCYKDFGLKKYEILATLDKHTSEICQELDGKVFFIKDYEVGTTAPPFHPNCRTTTVAYFDDDFIFDEKRAARNKDDKTYYIDGNINYKEWYKKYVK